MWFERNRGKGKLEKNRIYDSHSCAIDKTKGEISIKQVTYDCTKTGETKLGQNSINIRFYVYFRGQNRTIENSRRYRFAQSHKIENGLTRKTARMSRASAMDVFRASRHAGSRFRGNCVGKKNKEKN